MPVDVSRFAESWPKKCACGVIHSEEDWEHLHYLGIQESGLDDFPDMELRNCSSCGSTMAIVVPQDFAP